jgi:hypothetical protein
LTIGVGHVQAVYQHERFDRRVKARSAKAEHFRRVRVLEEQAAGDFVMSPLLRWR